jgi:hypothetical protein
MKTKRTLIIINWALSFCALCVDTERTPFWGVLAVVAWFGVSSFLLLFMDKRRERFDFEAFNKRFEENKLSNELAQKHI